MGTRPSRDSELQLQGHAANQWWWQPWTQILFLTAAESETHLEFPGGPWQQQGAGPLSLEAGPYSQRLPQSPVDVIRKISVL